MTCDMLRYFLFAFGNSDQVELLLSPDSVSNKELILTGYTSKWVLELSVGYFLII